MSDNFNYSFAQLQFVRLNENNVMVVEHEITIEGTVLASLNRTRAKISIVQIKGHLDLQVAFEAKTFIYFLPVIQ